MSNSAKILFFPETYAFNTYVLMLNNKPLVVELYVGFRSVWREKSESDLYLSLTIYLTYCSDQ